MNPEEQALLAAIAAHPEADLPRLVYSDWLQERDDVRYEWVRDRELFGWMGPQAENPIPRLLDALAEAYDADEYEAVETLQGLVTRCGAPAVGPLLERIGTMYSWTDFAREFAAEHPAALAENRAALETFADAESEDVRAVGLELLVRAGEVEPLAIARVLAETGNPDVERNYVAFQALRLARGPAADAVLAEWLPGLERDLEQPDLDEPLLTHSRAECLAGMTVESPRLAEFFRRAAVHANRELAAAGLEGLARLPDSSAEAVSLAIRKCDPGNVMEVYSLILRPPDGHQRLLETVRSPATPRDARQVLIRNLPNLDHDWDAIAPVYRAAVTHPDPDAREYALIALRESHGPTDAVHALIRSAEEDGNLGVRKMALLSFVQRDDTPERQKVAAVVAALGEREYGLAELATELMQTQNLTGEVKARLQRRRDDPDEQTRARAVAGLVRIGATTDEIRDALRDKAVPVRRAAARALSDVLPDDATHLLKPLRKALADPDSVVRGAAALAIGRLGTEAADAVDELLDLTRDPAPMARAGALQALPAIARYEASTTKALRRGLRDEDDRVVKATLVGLKEFYHPEPALQEAVFPWTRDESPEFRRLAFEALRNLDEAAVMSEAIEAFRRGVTDSDKEVADAATAGVSGIRTKAEPLLAELIASYARPDQYSVYHLEEIFTDLPGGVGARAAVAVLGSPHAFVRQRTLALIGKLFEKSPELRPDLATAAVPYLPALLTQERGAKLETVLDLIHIVGPRAGDCLSALLPLFDHRNATVREKALATTGRLGEAALLATDPLTDVMLNDPIVSARAGAAAGVTSLAEHDANLIPAVVRQLRDGPPEVRKAVARRIGLHPSLGGAVLPPLARCLAPENDAELRGIAAESLGKLGELMRPQAVNFARFLGRETEEDVRRAIVDAFGQLGPVAADAMPHLMAHFRVEESTTVRERLIDAFAKIPCPQRGAAVGLGLTDPAGGVREQVATVLGDIGADAAAILPAVCKAVENPKWDSVGDEHLAAHGHLDAISGFGIDRRQFLVEAIGELGPLAEPALPTLLKLLDDPHDRVRDYALDALIAVGRTAIPALKKAARHRNQTVRRRATFTLEELSNPE